ncbi:SGNH/GDSL hydrolase family protein [Sinomonas sp. ASV322]|uniref:SGNH/GDSL hydrolase family protein n=1 Tax=Sinomonas sp. ASV322 TaxID=3041920 RepID=UPI0027DB1788|nr:SGNH/GDSL hydrolase family protein [Sinomonas sp. ASV322]MDQ4503368.1 SGNH/GDSL hydrolase family protein [Sinomonas sp. ASV322]
MSGEFSTRWVALGDSFTEGVGDPDPSRPNGVRGWADRAAERLQAADPGFAYANLAIRGKKLRQVVAEQLEPALALRPTLVTLYAGANDILRPRVDIDALLEEYDAAVARLRDAGARVLLFTGFDAGSSKIFGAMRGRTAVYNEQVRWIAERRGATLVDYWRFHEFQDWRMWAEDRMHMSALGHATMANRVLGVLGHDGLAEVPEAPELPVLSVRERLRENVVWAREFAGPWVMRRLTGRSSGDHLSPKYPALTRL